MNVNWINAPFYEVSFIKINDFNRINKINDFINNLEELNFNIKIKESNNIENFLNNIDEKIIINIYIDICGIRNSKIIIEHLSNEIVQIDFCFFDGEIDDNCIKTLKQLLNNLLIQYNGIVGMVGCETVCSMLFFKTKKGHPHKDYSVKKIIKYTNNHIYKNDKKLLNGVDEIIWNNNIKL